MSSSQFVTFLSRSIYFINTLQLQPGKYLYIYYTIDIDMKFTHMMHYAEYFFPAELFFSCYIFLQTLFDGLFPRLCASSPFPPNLFSTSALQHKYVYVW